MLSGRWVTNEKYAMVATRRWSIRDRNLAGTSMLSFDSLVILDLFNF